MQKSESAIWISEMQLRQVFEEAFLHFPKETGGVLMGCQQGLNYIISDIIGPGPNSIHNTRSFKPDSDFQEKEIAKIYKEQRGSVTYLGDWHTHPNSNSYLSGIDKTTLKKIAQFKHARISSPIMLVLGTHPFELKCWRYTKNLISYNQYHEILVGYRKQLLLDESAMLM